MSFYITPEHYETAEKNGINSLRVYKRVNQLGWSIERAITEPIRPMLGLWSTWKEVAELHNVKRSTFYNRIYNMGFTPEEAATKQVPPRRVARELIDKALANGISDNHLRKRLEMGWSVERATTEPIGERGKYTRTHKHRKGGWK